MPGRARAGNKAQQQRKALQPRAENTDLIGQGELQSPVHRRHQPRLEHSPSNGTSATRASPKKQTPALASSVSSDSAEVCLQLHKSACGSCQLTKASGTNPWAIYLTSERPKPRLLQDLTEPHCSKKQVSCCPCKRLRAGQNWGGQQSKFVSIPWVGYNPTSSSQGKRTLSGHICSLFQASQPPPKRRVQIFEKWIVLKCLQRIVYLFLVKLRCFLTLQVTSKKV